MTNIQFSPQQQAVFDWVAKGRGSAFVEAVAGAGKTTTIIEACKGMSGSVAFAAYNKKIASEIEGKATQHGLGDQVRVGTFHKFGFSAWRRIASNVKLDARAKQDAISVELAIPSELNEFVAKLTSLAKNSAIGVCGSADDVRPWQALVEHHDLADALEDPRDLGAGIAYAQQALTLSRSMAREIIDFDDMIYMPIVTNCRVWQNDWLLVDEAQDINPARRLLARKMLRPNGRAIFVGDRCQPLGTRIAVPGGWSNIEDLKIGDEVVSYRSKDCSFMQRGRRVRGITRRPYAGHLIVATAPDGRASRYTPNHHCYASFAPLRGKHAVYLMRRGFQFRIGKCRMDYNHASGLSARLHAEKADAAWLLSVHDTEAEAFFWEQAIAGRFGLPQLMFSAKNMTRGPAQEYLPKAWGFIGDNSATAELCLSFFNRDARFPLFTRGTGRQQTIKRPMVVHATNLMPGVKMLPYNGRAHAKLSEWVAVDILIEDYRGDVVSIDVEDTHLYVADGLLTHNCQAIYGFTGADADAVDRLTEDFGCIRIPLTTTYRCPKAVVHAARNYVRHIEAHATAPEGLVSDAHEDDLIGKGLTASDVVLCRLTRPLVSTAFRFIRAGVACHVEGRDIGAGLLKLATRWKRIKSIDKLRERLDEYAEHEVEKLTAKKQEVKAEAVRDRVETLMVLMDGCGTIADLKIKIEALFTDSEDGHQKTLTLSTVHKSKGREWKRVFVLGFAKYMPSKMARQPWQVEQENNLIYVAFTRAKAELILVDVEPKKAEPAPLLAPAAADLQSSIAEGENA